MQNSIVKKSLVIGIIILFIGMNITTTISTGVIKKHINPISNGNILYVGGSGEGNYTKIQNAIDNASDWDTVFVYNGTYVENININKDGISLIGEDKNITILDGGGLNSVILIVENNYQVTISGFTIQNSGKLIWHNAGIEIQSGFNIINGNIIKNNQHGILLNLFPYSYINHISHNILFDNEQGITLDFVPYNYIYNNSVENNNIGIFVGDSCTPTKSLTLSLNRKSLTLSDFDNYIFRNIIKNNEKGIVIEPWYNTHVYNNSIIGNEYGIYLSAPFLTQCNYNYIYLNNIMNNRYGVLISQEIGGTYSQVKDNEIYHNNFIGNRVNAKGNGDNIWKENYWDNWIGLKFKKLRFLPYRIRGTFFKNIDWNPALEPYEIPVSSNFVGCGIK